jgi:hypothetical protein
MASATAKIRDWFVKFRQQRDVAAEGQAEAMISETQEERAASSDDLAAVAADQQAARIAGQTPTEADRLGE